MSHDIDLDKYAPHILEKRDQIKAKGTLREKVAYDLVDRPPYAFGMLTAADLAKYWGHDTVTIIEFGVAEGAGLKNLCEIGEDVSKETGINFEYYGFDTGAGLPPLKDYRDHPEIWSAGDFKWKDDTISKNLPKEANLIVGDIRDTIMPFLDLINEQKPIGFVSVDVDIYSSSFSALELFFAEWQKFLPVVPIYFDDIIGRKNRLSMLFRNRACGQFRAIDDFNKDPRAKEARIIDKVHNLKSRFCLKEEMWLDMMYAAHILNHPARNTQARSEASSIDEFGDEDGLNWPLS